MFDTRFSCGRVRLDWYTSWKSTSKSTLQISTTVNSSQLIFRKQYQLTVKLFCRVKLPGDGCLTIHCLCAKVNSSLVRRAEGDTAWHGTIRRRFGNGSHFSAQTLRKLHRVRMTREISDEVGLNFPGVFKFSVLSCNILENHSVASMLNPDTVGWQNKGEMKMSCRHSCVLKCCENEMRTREC